jgi:hypothetical protein
LANEPLAANGESAITLGLGDSGFLKERESASPGSDEDEVGFYFAGFSGGFIADGNLPAGFDFGEVGDPMPKVGFAALLRAKPRDELAREGSEVDVRSVFLFCGCDRFVVPAFGE